MRFIAGLLFSLSLLVAASPTRASAVLSDIGALTSSGIVVFGFTGEASLACRDGSVRTIPTAGEVTCGDGSVRNLLGEETIACADGSVRSISGSLIACDGSVRSVGDGSVRFVGVDQGALGSFCFDNVQI